MTPLQTAGAAVGFAACLVTLAGLLCRGKLRTCRAFAAYLATMTITAPLITLWPSVFYTQRFWAAKEILMNALELGIAAELAWWTFAGFPGAAGKARLLLLALLAGTFVAVALHPDASEYMLEGARARLQIGAAWLFAAIAGLTLYYDIPVRRIHRAVLFGCGLHFTIFGIILQYLITGTRYERTLATLDQLTFVAITVGWAVAAWLRERVPAVDPGLAVRLQPWRVL